MARLTGHDAAVIALYATFTMLIGLGAGFAFGYGYPKAGVALALDAVFALALTWNDLRQRLEGRP